MRHPSPDLGVGGFYISGVVDHLGIYMKVIFYKPGKFPDTQTGPDFGRIKRLSGPPGTRSLA